MSTTATQLAQQLTQPLWLTLGRSSGICAFGSAARPNDFIQGFSDLDLIIYTRRIEPSVFTIAAEWRASCQVDTTLVILDEGDLYRLTREVAPVHSILLNALSGRPTTQVPLHGDVPLVKVSDALEKACAAAYVMQHRIMLRRALVEIGETPTNESTKKLTRWAASLIRSALRARGVFVDPYEPSLEVAKPQAPGLDWDPVLQLFMLRRNGTAAASFSMLSSAVLCAIRFADQQLERHEMQLALARG